MNLKLYKDIKVTKSEGKYLFMNPAYHTVLKCNEKTKKLIDCLLSDESELEYTIEDSEVKKVIDTFLKRKILFDKDVFEGEPTNEVDYMYIHKLYMKVINTCNLSCEFCCAGSNKKNLKEEIIDIELLKNMVDEICEKKITVNNVNITGGEPLLRRDIIELILYIGEKLNCTIDLSTNGMLITEEFMQRVSSLKHRLSFCISVENMYDSKEEFDKLSKVLNIVRENEFNMVLSFVTTRENYYYLFDYIDLCVEYDAIISLKNFTTIENNEVNDRLFITKEQWRILHTKIVNYIYVKGYDGKNVQAYIDLGLKPMSYCSAKDKVISIDSDGNMYACPNLHWSSFCYGNIEEGIESILNNRKKLNGENIYNNTFNVDEYDKCKKCEIRYFCRNGCVSDHFSKYKEKEDADCYQIRKIYKFLLHIQDNNLTFNQNLKNYLNILSEE